MKLRRGGYTRTRAATDAVICLVLSLGVWCVCSVAPAPFVTWDEPAWVFRSVKFLAALSRGDLAGTLLTGHPGVLTTWSGALSLLWHRYVSHAVSAAQLDAIVALEHFDVHGAEVLRQLGALLPAARSGIVVLHAATAALTFLLLQHLLGRRYALAASLFLALDPYHLALSRVLHVDALNSTLLLISVLGLLAYDWRAGRRYLLLSGVAAGLAILNKSSGVLAAPCALLLLLRRRRVGGERQAGGLGRALLTRMADAGLWTAVAAATFVALWPAVWVAGREVWREVAGFAEICATDPGGATSTFFRGQEVVYPGPSFYPIAMVLRTTPLVLVGSALAVVGLAARDAEGASGPRRRVKAALILHAVLYMALMTLARKMYDRYALPALLAADVLAALGWVWALEAVLRALGVARRAGLGARKGVPGTVAALLALGQGLALLAPLYPAHYLMYYNPWAGGLQQALRTVPVGWGEGIEQVARYLATRPDAPELSVSTLTVAGLAPFFSGEVVPRSGESVLAADYVLLYVSDVQAPDPVARRYYRAQEPEFVAVVNGVEYAWLYRNDYHLALSREIAQAAEPGDVVIANAPSLLQRALGDGLRQGVVQGNSEAEVAEALQSLTEGARRIFYVDYEDGRRGLREWIGRQLAQSCIPLWEETFLHGALRCYELPPRTRFAAVEARVAAEANFGDQLSLDAYGVSRRRIEEGQALGVGLAWRTLQPLGQDYQVFVHLVDGQGRIWGQGDGSLADEGQTRASAWEQGVSHLCRYLVAPETNVPAGLYWLLVGIYRLEDLTRLPMLGPDGEPLGDAFTIGPIRVGGPPRGAQP